MGGKAVWFESFDYDEATFYRYFAVLRSERLGETLLLKGGVPIVLSTPISET